MLSYLGSAGGMGGRGGLLGGSQQQNTFLKKLTSSMGREPRIIFIFPGLRLSASCMRSLGPDRFPKKVRFELQPFAQASLGPILPNSAGSVSVAARTTRNNTVLH